MPTPTYTPLANLTLSSSASILTFSSITANYRDLVLVVNTKVTTGTNLGIYITLNSDFGNNYNEVAMDGDGTGASSSVATNAGAATLARFNTNDGLYLVNFMDYSATDKHKSFLSRNDVAATATRAMAHRWASTSAINSIRIAASSSTFVAGSTFALYGIAA